LSNVQQTIRVNLGPRSYDIRIGAGCLPEIGPLLAERGKVSHVLVVTDENVEKPHAVMVAEALSPVVGRVDLVVVGPGEETKSIETATALWQGMVELKSDRKSLIVAVGGGVVGDLAGFIAATYARGLGFVQVPTSLLAQVDSSVGGKVGINLPTAKNMVGAFLQPQAVLIDTQTLSTLPPRELRAGLAEVVKYGVILDAELFAYLEAHQAELLGLDPAVLAQTIARCCRLKADVVEQDEREETGLRAVLNYGHTFGHALETVTGYTQVLHGEAVSIGMVLAADLARRLGRVDDAFVARQNKLLTDLQLPVTMPELNRQTVIDAMAHDKKVEYGRLRFVLPDRMGHVELVDNVPTELVQAVVTEAA